MPYIKYDRSHATHDFEMIDLRTAAQVEVQVDPKGAVWINLNGKCLLRVANCSDIVIEDKRRT